MSGNTRKIWIESMHKIAYPIIKNAASGTLHSVLPLSNDEKKEGLPILKRLAER